MKIRSLVIALVALLHVQGALAVKLDSVLLAPAGTSGKKLNNNWYIKSFFDSGRFEIPVGQNIWLRDDSWPDNKTIADGVTVFSRGGQFAGDDEDPGNIIDLKLTVTNNLIGRFYIVAPQDRDDVGLGTTTTIIGDDDPNVSSLVGFSADRGNNNQKVADNAVTIRHQDNHQSRHVKGQWDFVEGNYYGGENFHGLYNNFGCGMNIIGSSFVAGDGGNRADLASGMWINRMVGNLIINNKADYDNDRFQGSTYRGANFFVTRGSYYNEVSFEGGDGLTVENATGNVDISGGDFYASMTVGGERTIDATPFDNVGMTVKAFGGRGMYIRTSGTVNIKGGNYYGGNAFAAAFVSGGHAAISTEGGSGIIVRGSGATTISDGKAYAGRSGYAEIVPTGTFDVESDDVFPESDEFGSASALGGSGIYLFQNGDTVISNMYSEGSAGGVAIAKAATSEAVAIGGSGILGINTKVTVKSGTYIGGKSGEAIGEGSLSDGAGAGATVTGKSLIIHGGRFIGGAGDSGFAGVQNNGVWIQDADLTVEELTDRILIEGNVLLENDANKFATINSGTITGDLYTTGGGTTTLTIKTNTVFSGKIVQRGGTFKVANLEEGAARFFKNVEIDDGTMEFDSGVGLKTVSGSLVSLNSHGAAANFKKGLELSSGSVLNQGTGKLTVSNLTLRSESLIRQSVDFENNILPTFEVLGNFVATNTTGEVVVRGVATKPSGSYHIAKIDNMSIGAKRLKDVFNVDFGWLTSNDVSYAATSLDANYNYRSLTNEFLLEDLSPTNLVAFDALLTDTNNASVFFGMNALGAEQGAKTVRFASSQASDAFDTTLHNQSLIHQQYAARATSFRSVNGFASTRPGFSPEGAAGPIKDSGLQGWIKAYGGHSSRDKDDATKYDDYDATIYGTVIGLDKSWNNLLIGIAGGYAASDLDAGATYSADLRSWHGSIYSTIGNENVYVDLAGTYAGTDVDESSPMIQNGSYKSSSASGYIGAGMKFEVSKAIAITPEASMLATYYEQDAYDRKIISETQVIGAYDEWSYLGAIGLNIASAKKINWDNAGLVFTPEVRGHWLHEFNDEPADITYTMQGSEGHLGVRARDADMFKLGLGFDIWNWKYQNTMFEIDYDGLFGESFTSHTISGKISHRF